VEYLVQLCRHLFISLKVRLYDYQLWTQALGQLDGLRRMHPEPSGFVAGSRHHTTLGIVTNRYRLALQFWIIALLYSGEELIHIHMNNLHKPINLGAKVQIIIQIAVRTPTKKRESHITTGFSGDLQKRCIF